MLRDKIAACIDKVDTEAKISGFYASPTDYADAILDLPEMKELMKKAEKVCEWRHDEDIEGEFIYGTSCGEEFYFYEGNIKDNATIFCPFCGGKIKEE